jgi:hypothetical protein
MLGGRAAGRASRPRLRYFLLIAVALLGLLGGLVGEQLGLWSLRGGRGPRHGDVAAAGHVGLWGCDCS